jgi:hypothetical protein
VTRHPTAKSSCRWLPRRADVLGGVLAASGALLVAGWALQIWQASPHVPFQIGGDANLTLDALKNQLRGDWYYTTNLLGAPFGQKLFDYPAAGDAMNLLVVKALGLFTSDPALVMNVFFVLTFPLVALGAFVALRVLHVQVAVACGLAASGSVRRTWSATSAAPMPSCSWTGARSPLRTLWTSSRSGGRVPDQVESGAVQLDVAPRDLPEVLDRDVIVYNVPDYRNNGLQIHGRPDGIDGAEGALIPIEMKSHRDVQRTDELELVFYWMLLDPFRTRDPGKPRGYIISEAGRGPGTGGGPHPAPSLRRGEATSDSHSPGEAPRRPSADLPMSDLQSREAG